MRLPGGFTISPHTGQCRGKRTFRIVSLFIDLYTVLFFQNAQLRQPLSSAGTGSHGPVQGHRFCL